MPSKKTTAVPTAKKPAVAKKEVAAEKSKKASPLQEALKRILKAKSITLKSSGKKIK